MKVFVRETEENGCVHTYMRILWSNVVLPFAERPPVGFC